jgi:drug/metabolite transporter (DMT)-like permease
VTGPETNIDKEPAATDYGQSLFVISVGVVFSSLWSSAFIAGKVGLEAAPPLVLLAGRFLLAGLLMILVSSVVLDWRPRGADAWRCWTLAFLLGLLNNVLYLGMSFYALRTLPAGLVILILSTAPILTAVIAYPALGESLNVRKSIGMLVSLAGVGIIVFPRIGTDDISQLVGITLVCASTLALACGTVVYKRFATQIPAFWINTWSTFFSALVFLPAVLAFDSMKVVKWNFTLFGSVAYLVVVVTIGAMLIWFWLIRRVGASKASILHMFNPPLGMLLAWAILNEVPSWNELVGIVPVSLGVFLVIRDK